MGTFFAFIVKVASFNVIFLKPVVCIRLSDHVAAGGFQRLRRSSSCYVKLPLSINRFLVPKVSTT